MEKSPYSEKELLEIAKRFKRHLGEHYPRLKEVCPGLDKDFIIRFKALYYQIQSHPMVTDKEKTESISKKLEVELDQIGMHAKKMFGEIRFFIQKAFPYDLKKWEAFGYCEIEGVVHDFQALRDCLKTFNQMVQEKRSKLIIAGCSESIIDEVEQILKLLETRHEELAQVQKNSMKLYHEHKSNLKALYKLMQMIHDAATKCYSDHPEILQELTFPQKKR